MFINSHSIVVLISDIIQFSTTGSSTSVHAAKMNSSDETVEENLASESDVKIL